MHVVWDALCVCMHGHIVHVWSKGSTSECQGDERYKNHSVVAYAAACMSPKHCMTIRMCTLYVCVCYMHEFVCVCVCVCV